MSIFDGLYGPVVMPTGAGSTSSGGVIARDAQRQAEFHEDRLNRLTLICQALWELLRDRGELTEEDLITKISEIDLRDGRADGKISKQIKHCPKCDRVMSPRHQKCMYCGAINLQITPFDAAR